VELELNEVVKMKVLLIQFASNVIDESDLQPEKHFDPTISALFGIMIEEVMTYKKLLIQFVSNVNLIQM
jgi:hypothetical protein